MKRLFLIPTFLILSICLSAQNYETFKKQREQGVQDLKQQSEDFAKNREAEYQKFKKMYEDEFEKYKKNYNDFLSGEISVVDLMASDDNITIKELDDKYKPKEIKSTAAAEKREVEKEQANLANMTSEQALSSFSKSKDKVQRMKEGVAALRTLNQSFAVTTASSDPVIDNSVVSKDKPAEVKLTIHEEEAAEIAAAKADSIKAADKAAAKKAAAKADSIKAAEDAARRADEEADARAAEEARKERDALVELMIASAAQADKEAAEKAAADKAAADKAAAENKNTSSADPVEASVPKGKPTDYKRISSPFGERIHPITHKKSTHKGVDMAANNMTPIYATADGTIVYASVMGGYGNFIKINHENGYKTAYAHLEKIATSNNKKVHKGDLIGYVGTTGQSTGNHLHYEVYFEDKLIDPEKTL